MKTAPPSTSLQAERSLEVSILKLVTYWEGCLRFWIVTPITVTTAPMSIIIHSPTALLDADQACGESIMERA